MYVHRPIRSATNRVAIFVPIRATATAGSTTKAPTRRVHLLFQFGVFLTLPSSDHVQRECPQPKHHTN